MASGDVLGLGTIRERLDKSQQQMAGLLGVSLRALQSYEQGWRRVPPHVIKQAWLLLLLKRRTEPGGVQPCWVVRGCDQASREACPVHELGAGDLCWLLSAQCRCGGPAGALAAQMDRCEQCPVLEHWLAG